MAKAVKQLIDRLQGGITQTGEIRSPVVIVYEDDLIGLESKIAQLEAELEKARASGMQWLNELVDTQIERDVLIRLLEPLYEAIKPFGDKICPHGNTANYPVHGRWCDECWQPVIDYFEGNK